MTPKISPLGERYGWAAAGSRLYSTSYDPAGGGFVSTGWPDFPEPLIVNLGAMLSHIWRVSGESTLVIGDMLDDRDVVRLWREGAGGGWRPVSSPAGWTTYRREQGDAKVHVAVRSLLHQGRTPLWDLVADGGAMVTRALAWYHATVGVPYLMTPGVSGCALARALHPSPRRGQAPHWGKSVDVWPVDIRGAGDILWTRTPTELERAQPYVHGFDLRGARLAAAGVADLPFERCLDTGALGFDPGLAGFWQVRTDQLPEQDPAMPPLWEPTTDRLTWLSAPVAKELWKAGQLPEVFGSRTAPARQWLRSWSTRLGTARVLAESDPEAPERWAATVKATYAETVGMMMKRGGSIFRPEVSWQIIDRQRVTLLTWAARVRAGRGDAPIGAVTDCLYYASPFADPAEAAEDLGLPLPAVPRLGAFRSYAVHTMSDWLDQTEEVAA